MSLDQVTAEAAPQLTDEKIYQLIRSDWNVVVAAARNDAWVRSCMLFCPTAHYFVFADDAASQTALAADPQAGLGLPPLWALRRCPRPARGPLLGAPEHRLRQLRYVTIIGWNKPAPHPGADPGPAAVGRAGDGTRGVG